MKKNKVTESDTEWKEIGRYKNKIILQNVQYMSVLKIVNTKSGEEKCFDVKIRR